MGKLAHAAHGERGIVGKLRKLITLLADLDTLETGLAVESYTQTFRDNKEEECREVQRVDILELRGYGS